ncbi:antiviral reverse transcriptase Drt3b [Variovorax sp. R-27]|uniref:antiviral reverse transcriptase Drt3b n=1 Tax=Variovorax sp. R-27 TaxID=3404058 RepID=UPI003CF5360C
MLKNAVKIRKSDGLRAILTDVLPYEVPMLFSNEGLYNFLQTNNPTVFREKFSIDILATPRYTIPYSFKIKKNPTELRSLSVMHPAQQIHVANFYKNYYGMILAQCQKSNWTLRAPASIASYYVEKPRAKKNVVGRSDTVDPSVSGFEGVPRTASSYFTYKNYGFLHKFFESSEFHALEKKFPLLLKLDISQCFGRIYTHTIAWAVKSKEYAKKNRSATFESAFDSLMQNANYAETAGIIVGPEISRIFAEIILQQIDLNIERALEDLVDPLLHGVDYDIRRYVDDYFVFAKRQDDLPRIQLAISECLAPYRLSLNEAKSMRMIRPFSTAETSARIEIVATISDVFSRAIAEDEETDASGLVSKIFRPTRTASSERLANSTIRDIKRALRANDTVFDTASNYFFSAVKRLIIRYTGKLDPKGMSPIHLEWSANFVLAIIENVFFFYASSPRVRQTYLVSEILLLITEYFRKAPSSSSERIFSKISQEIKLSIASGRSGDEGDGIEKLNLLLVLQNLGGQHVLDGVNLPAALNVSSKSEKFVFPKNYGYFQMATTLYIIENMPEHKGFKDALIDYILSKFNNDADWMEKSELVMLILDVSACPYLTEAERKKIIKSGLGHKIGSKNLTEKAGQFFELTSKGNWFFNWSKSVGLYDILQRKELRTPY